MNFAVLRPPSECLSLVPEKDSKQAPHRRQCHIGHNWRDVARLYDPRGDELAESITPQIFVHGDGDEKWPLQQVCTSLLHTWMR